MIFVYEYIMRLMVETLIAFGFIGAFSLYLAVLARKVFETRERVASINTYEGTAGMVMSTLTVTELTPKQASSFLGVSKKDVEAMMKDGQLPYSVANGRKYILAKDVLGVNIRKALSAKNSNKES